MLLPLPDGRWRLVAMSTPGVGPLSHWVTAWQRSSYRQRHSLEDIARSLWQRVFDETPEGKSIVRLAEKVGAKAAKAEGIEFSAKTHEWDKLTGWR